MCDEAREASPRSFQIVTSTRSAIGMIGRPSAKGKSEDMCRMRSMRIAFPLMLVGWVVLPTATANAQGTRREPRQEERETQAVLNAIHAQMDSEEPPPDTKRVINTPFRSNTST